MNKKLCVLMCLVVLAGARAHADANGAVVNAADFASPDSLTGGLQEAVDALPEGGGTVVIPPGRYVLRRRVNLAGKHNVTLKGAGADTILTRSAQAFSRLTETASCHDDSLAVESTDGFRVGDEVVVYDTGSVGWNLAHNYVKAVLPGRLKLQAALEGLSWIPPNWAYKVERGAAVINRFPALAAGGTRADPPTRGVRILDLTIDGNLAENPNPWTDFTTAGLHFNNPHDLLIRGVTVREWPSDGISLQWGKDVRVEDCLVERCVGHGLHPGTSIRNVAIVGNTSRYNTGDGLFYCFDVQHTRAADNVFIGNLRSGIGNLGYSGDQNNLVENNTILSNQLWGIEAFSGKHNVIRGNIVKHNSRAEPGKYGEITLFNNTGSVVTNNTFISSGGPGGAVTRRFAIVAGGRGEGNIIRDNVCQDAVRLWPSTFPDDTVTFPDLLLRFGNQVVLAARQGMDVRITLRGRALGSNRKATAWSVDDACGQQLTSGSVAAGETAAVRFAAPATGLYLLNLSSGWSGCSLVSANVPVALGFDSKVNMVHGAERLYFHVPPGIEQFTVAAGSPPPETVRLDILHPNGELAATAQTAADKKLASIEVAVGNQADAVWSLRLSKADTGPFEDCSVEIDARVSPLSLVPEQVFSVGKAPRP